MATASTFVVTGGTVVPLEGRKVVHDPGAVLVIEGCIAAVGSVADVARHPATATAAVVDATGHAVIP